MPDICVYALTAAGAGRLALRGTAGDALRAVRVGDLDAIVGRVRSRPKPTDANLRKHSRLMTALWQHAPALLPARFGTTIGDLSELQLLVGSRHQLLRRNLRAVRGRAQMTVRIWDRGSGIGDRGSGIGDQGSGIGDRGSGIRDQGSGSGERGTGSGDPRSGVVGVEAGLQTRPASKGAGAEYLRARAAEERRTREVPAFAPCRAAVQQWVRAERVEKTAGVATIYHLVPRGAAARYSAALDRAARDARLRLIVSGPWPPYAFADSW